MNSANPAEKSDPGADGAVSERWEPRDARRRRQLIEATIASIAKFGLPGTTVAKVAELAGLSTGIVGFYFQGKKALLLSTLEYVNLEFEEMQQEALEGAGDDPVRQLEATIEINFDPKVYDRGRVAVWNAFWGEAGTRDDYHRVCGAREAAEERQVIALFERIGRDGNYSNLDAEALGRGFYHMVTSLHESRPRDRHTPFDFEGAKATCRGFLSSIFPREFPADIEAPRGEPAGEATVSVREESAFETLPTWVYHDPEFYALEQEYIFRRSWLLAGHISQVPEPGDYVGIDVADERAFVIRGRDGQLRAFYNVCQHRASRVVRDEWGSCSRAIVCPYHGWAYDFDGALRGVPAEETYATLDKSRLGLPEIELEQWMGFLFIRFDGGGASVAETLEPLEESLRPYRIEAMKPHGQLRRATHDFNWKLFAEYDADESLTGWKLQDPPDPRDTARHGVEPDDRVLPYDEKAPAWTRRTYQRLLPQLDCVPAEYRREAVHHAIFPGAVLRVSPDLIECMQALPTAADRCQLRSFAVAPIDDRREMRAARYLNSRISRMALGEMLDICRWTDKGLRSDSYRGGILSEGASSTRAFHRNIRDLIPVARRREMPAAGCVAKLNQEMRRDG